MDLRETDRTIKDRLVGDKDFIELMKEKVRMDSDFGNTDDISANVDEVTCSRPRSRPSHFSLSQQSQSQMSSMTGDKDSQTPKKVFYNFSEFDKYATHLPLDM